MASDGSRSLSETFGFVIRAMKQRLRNSRLNLVILSKEEEFMGVVNAATIDTKIPQIGIWIKEEYGGNHYGREAVIALKDWIDENVDYDYITYNVDYRNIPSQKIVEALGGVPFKCFYWLSEKKERLLQLVQYRIYSKNYKPDF